MICDCQLSRSAKQFRVQVVALFLGRFVHFCGNAVGIGVGVVADSGHLPGNLDAGPVGFDREAGSAGYDPDAFKRSVMGDSNGTR